MSTDRARRTAIGRRNLRALRENARWIQRVVGLLLVAVTLACAWQGAILVGVISDAALVMTYLGIHWAIKKDILDAEAELAKQSL